jgi:hypothetical protein
MSETVPFIVQTQSKGISLRAVEIPIDTLKANLAKATAALGTAFESIVKVGQFELQEVEIGVEVGAEGGVEFIGTATASGKASITLKFRPKSSLPE